MTTNDVAIQLQKFKTWDKLIPSRGSNIYHAGIKDNDKGYIKYAPPSSTNPTLLVVTPIYDDDDNVIMPGYYELVLSEDRTMLLMVQNGEITAKMPVFRVEEDRTQEQVAQPMDNKSQKQQDKEQKKKEKTMKKAIAQGQIASEPEIYTNATIQHDVDGNYYLIKYERGKIRAWGAIK